MIESDIMRAIQIEASKLGCRLFRNNVGTGWVGKTTQVNKIIHTVLMPGDIVIKSPRPLIAGLCKGSSDLIGFSSDGEFLAVEVKTESGIVKEDQQIFIDTVNKNGGIAGVCRSVQDFRSLIKI